MKQTILLIEDNPDDLALIMRAIERSGRDMDTIVQRDAASALVWLQESGRDHYTMPSLILLDLSLPQIDGVGFLQRIRGDSLTQAIPVVVYTGNADEAALSACYACGCNSYVRKPVRYSEFTDVVMGIIHYWLSINEPISVKT